jgi:hypothetical protein
MRCLDFFEVSEDGASAGRREVMETGGIKAVGPFYRAWPKDIKDKDRYRKT